MSTTPTTEEEWSQFRFPKAIERSGEPPVDLSQAKPLPPPPAETEGEDDDGEGEQGSEALVLPLPPEASHDWVFVPESRSLRNTGLKKQIALSDLDTGAKIVRLLAVFRVRPDLHADSFSEALTAACRHRFGLSVEDVIAQYSHDASIPWTAPPAVVSRPSSP